MVVWTDGTAEGTVSLRSRRSVRRGNESVCDRMITKIQLNDSHTHTHTHTMRVRHPQLYTNHTETEEPSKLERKNGR